MRKWRAGARSFVGYKISPLLDKVRRGERGRVQSVAVRLSASARKISAPSSRWSIVATATLEGRLPPPFKAKLVQWKNRRSITRSFVSKTSTVQSIVSRWKARRGLSAMSKRKSAAVIPRRRSSPASYSRKRRASGFPTKRTMQLAQHLYEASSWAAKDRWTDHLHGTDSTRISDDAIAALRVLFKANTQELCSGKPNSFRSKKGAQDAHEAIRPTSLE